MNKYIVFDTETGGLESSTSSLLTCYFGIVNDRLEVVAELDLAVKPADDIYAVSAGALKVNKIDLVEHDRLAIPYPQAALMLYSFIKEHAPTEKLTPIAHNISFDYSFVFDKLLEKHLWQEHVSYRSIDTMGIALYLAERGLLPSKSLQLAYIAKVLGVSVAGQLHRAKTDALLCLEVYKRMLTI